MGVIEQAGVSPVGVLALEVPHLEEGAPVDVGHEALKRDVLDGLDTGNGRLDRHREVQLWRGNGENGQREGHTDRPKTRSNTQGNGKHETGRHKGASRAM